MRKILLALQLIFVCCISLKGNEEPPIVNGWYEISTLQHLRWVSENPSSWDKNYRLMNDIDASDTRNWNDGAGLSPIGNYSINFTGKFDGNGYIIDKLYINRPNQDFIGLFGIVYGEECKIYHLGVTNSNILGLSFVGGLVGSSYASIANCYTTGKVSGTSEIGGIIGYSIGIISYSYSTNSVSGNIRIGGLIGFSSGTVENCFWDIEKSGLKTSDGGIGKTSAEMASKSTFINAHWNFKIIWKIDANVNSGYPFLDDRTIPKTTALEPTDTDDDGYINIKYFAHLVWVSENSSSWSSNFELDNDISADSTFYWESLSGFSPMGNFSKPFSGKFEGNGYKIDSLYISLSSQSFVGLFSCISFNCIISNLGISNAQIDGGSCTGGLLGYNKYGTIINCYCKGMITGKDNIGGLVGKSEFGNISKCYYSGIVLGSKDNIGGLVGWQSGIILNCFSKGNVKGQSYCTGGLVGNNNGKIASCYSNSEVVGTLSSTGGLVGSSVSTIINCYSTGSVSGNAYTGGLAGSINGIVSNCYSIGAVSGSTNTGGLVGSMTYFNVTNCFWDTESSGMTTSAGGIGLSTKEMMMKSNYLKHVWNFQAIWKIDPNVNNGYPYLDDRTIPITQSTEPFDTDDDGYINIKYLSHLVWISEKSSSWSSNFELDNDINADSTYLWDTFSGFSPIGNSIKPYTGKFEGNSYKIKNIFIYREGEENIGFFGTIGKECKINSLGIVSFDITGRYNIGGLVG